MSGNNFTNDPEIIKEFVAEFNEHLQALELNLLELENDPSNMDILNSIFRPVHTLKGAANFLGFEAIGSFSHELENLLDKLRKGKKKADQGIIDLLLICIDVIKNFIGDVSKGGNGSSIDTTDVVFRILELSGKAAVAGAPEGIQKTAETDDKTKADMEAYLVAMQQHLRSIKKSLDESCNINARPRLIDNLFRAVHSMKASTEYMKFSSFLTVSSINS